MEQLSGLDAMFLHLEASNTPMHIAPLMIYDPSTSKNGFVRFKDILQTFEQRLHLSNVFRRKLVTVPLQLDQPYWVEDPDFDLEFHVRHISLPKPGDWRQFYIQIARLHARPLDRSRPLWEAYVIEGLDDLEGLPPGCFAVFLKIHHAAIDGASGVEIISAIHDLMPNAISEPNTATWAAERDPSNIELLSRAWLNNMRKPSRWIKMARKTIPALKRVNAGKKEGKFDTLGTLGKTRFNDTVSSHRVIGSATFDLATVRAIKASVEGATVNDAVLTIVGGGMQRYLVAKNEEPRVSLVVGAPVNVRSASQVGTGGNVVSMMSLSLCSQIKDPVQRMSEVHRLAVESKAYHNAVGATMMSDLGESLPASLMALGSKVASAANLLARVEPVFNTIVTNVPGPQVPLYMSGAQLVRNLGAGPITDGMGLFQVVTSYNGQISISYQACREMMSDPALYEQCLNESFEELRKSALGSKDASVKKTSRKKTTTKKKSSTSKKVATSKKTATSKNTATRKKTSAKKRKIVA